MYIYKMVFAEKEQFSEEDYVMLRREDIIHFTDYDTYEILTDDVQSTTDKEVTRALQDGLGTDVYDLLAKGDIDLVLVVY